MRSRLLNVVFVWLGVSGVCLAQSSVESVISVWLSLVAYEAVFDEIWSWGIVITLFCHEAGHILAARLVGVRTSMPIFIPFLGAVISLKSCVRHGRGEAAVALGGPALGGLVGMIFLILYGWTQERTYLLWAYLGAQFNLFNLLPCRPFDGGRIAGSIARYAWCAFGIWVVGCLWLWRQPIFIFFLAGAVWRYYRTDTQVALAVEQRMWITICYLLLLVLLEWLTIMVESLAKT